MGYTNYWNNSKKFTQVQWGKVLRDFKETLTFKEFTFINIEIEMINRTHIIFNGVNENSHETFCLSHNSTDFGFCKTARKPYDKICQALLIIASHYNKHFEYSSDGDETDWEQVNKIMKDYYSLKGLNK